jgi:hypothetical protein
MLTILIYGWIPGMIIFYKKVTYLLEYSIALTIFWNMWNIVWFAIWGSAFGAFKEWGAMILLFGINLFLIWGIIMIIMQLFAKRNPDRKIETIHRWKVVLFSPIVWLIAFMLV